MRVYLAAPVPKPAPLAPGEAWRREASLVEAWNGLFLHGGSYVVKAKYLNLEAHAEFQVTVDVAGEMPTLIDLYEKSPALQRQNERAVKSAAAQMRKRTGAASR